MKATRQLEILQMVLELLEDVIEVKDIKTIQPNEYFLCSIIKDYHHNKISDEEKRIMINLLNLNKPRNSKYSRVKEFTEHKSWVGKNSWWIDLGDLKFKEEFKNKDKLLEEILMQKILYMRALIKDFKEKWRL